MKYREEGVLPTSAGLGWGPRSIDKKQIYGKLEKKKELENSVWFCCCLNHRAVWERERGREGIFKLTRIDRKTVK